MGTDMKIQNWTALLIYVAATACASAPTTPTAPEPTYLSAEAFQAVWDKAYSAKPPAESEAAFVELIARTDITAEQRAEAYYGRGLIRGNWVRDFPMAFPQCAVSDLARIKEASPENKFYKVMNEQLDYQFSRFGYFGDAPQSCKDDAEALRVKLGR